MHELGCRYFSRGKINVYEGLCELLLGSERLSINVVSSPMYYTCHKISHPLIKGYRCMERG